MTVFWMLLTACLISTVNSRNATCNVRPQANCKKFDLDPKPEGIYVDSFSECCAFCTTNAKCKAWTLDYRKAADGHIGRCYLKFSCDGLEMDQDAISGVMSDGEPFPFAPCQFTDLSWSKCEIATFPGMCDTLDFPGCCHWCGLPDSGSCNANRTACPG